MPRISTDESESDGDEDMNTFLTVYAMQLMLDSQRQMVNSLTRSSSSRSDSDSDSDSDMAHSISDYMLQTLLALYAAKLIDKEEERARITEQHSQLAILLTVYKTEKPDVFRSYTRLWPATFDALLDKISNNPVFENGEDGDEDEPLSVEEQLCIALFRFGHHGNAATLEKVAFWAGVDTKTADMCTRRVMVVVGGSKFKRTTFKWPKPEERETHKAWVEEHSCSGWRDGWLMAGGTLVPFSTPPTHSRSSWYDRKGNYSMNLQLVCTPDLMIIDYAVGVPGGQTDAAAWKNTRLLKEHQKLLEPNEWVWADTAYPLKRWCQTPYRRPEKDIDENATYNDHLSQIRDRSEQCVGFLKSRWSSLNSLPIEITSMKRVQVATLWIVSCISLHCFAMQHEESEIDMDVVDDEFYQEGARWLDEERFHRKEDQRKTGKKEDQDGLAFREELKRRLHQKIED